MASPWLSLLVAVVPAAAQQSDISQLEFEIASDARLEQRFRLNNRINCPRERYRFRLTTDQAFVSLPLDTVELSRSASTGVTVIFDGMGLAPGTYPANIMIACVDCGRCRTRDKTLRIVMTVTEPGSAVVGVDTAPAADVVIEDTETPVDSELGVAVPDVVGLGSEEAEAMLTELGLVPVIDNPDIAGVEGATVASQVPAATALVPVGTSVSVVLASAGRFALPYSWLSVAVFVLLLITLVFYRLGSAGSGTSAVATIEICAEEDPGTQRVWPDISEQQQTAVRVRLLSDAGEFSIHGDPVPGTMREEP